MNHKGTVTLETKRLILRKFELSDAEYVYKNWASDDEVTKYLMWQTHEDIEATKEYIEFVKNGYNADNSYDWVIVEKESGEPIGSIGVVNFNEKAKLVHIGYCIGRNWWHQGITSEAFARVIEFLFNEVEVNRIESRHDKKNPNSGKVMEKCGLKYEGTLRQSDWNNQGLCDAKWYAILREDYLNK